MKFKRMISLVLCLSLVFAIVTGAFSASDTELNSKVLPSTWAAVDGLGRTLSTNADVGDKDNEKTVAMFYWTWHQPWIKDYEPITTGSVLDFYPEAINNWNHPAWNNTPDGRPYFWDEPLYGFYANTDEYVLRKHAELLADADIDVVFFDTTNGDVLFHESTLALLKVWNELKDEGVNVPQISYILNFADDNLIKGKLYELYDQIYSLTQYNDLFYKLDGKPMLMADSRALDLSIEKDKEIFNFFNFRRNNATYFNNDFPRLYDTWGWCSDYEQTRYGYGLFGGVEQICVSVAQNANENGLSAMNNPVGTVQGRGYAQGDYSYSYNYAGKNFVIDMNTENAHYYGLNFQQQWDYAIENDPDVVFVTGFNEWIAGRFIEWNGTQNAFPDQFSPEYSRDIEPTKGELKDYYYYQLVENVRRFKGADAQPENNAEKTINIDASPSQWDNVLPEYNHYSGGVERDSVGWKGCHYKNDTFRNDIVKAKAAYDDNNIYFYVETADDLTPSTDSNWMRLFLDTDVTGVSPNWEGFEYVINRNGANGNLMTVEISKGNYEFETVGTAEFAVIGNVLQLEVPRSLLSMSGDEVKFNFKWSDNMQEFDVMDFYQNGDVAPGGRFTFVFDSTAEGSESAEETYSFFDRICEKFNAIYIEIRKLINYYR